MEPKRPYTETEPETAAQTPGTAASETAAPGTAPEKPRESFFRRRRRELADIWREIYCNSRVRCIRTWQIAVFALMIVEAAVMAIAVHPAYWVGAGLLALRETAVRPPAGAALRRRCRALRRDRRAHRHFCRRAGALSAVRA